MTIKEIAALAGVSVSTVSKIMNGKDGNINPATRSRVLKIAKEHHYEPYSTIKNITAPRKFLIGLLVKSFCSSSMMIGGILETAQKYGYQLLLFNSENSLPQELKHITALCNSRVDGVIWEPVGEQSIEYEHFFTKQNIPICYLNAPEGFPSYAIDFRKAGYDLTQELISHKHTHITCLLRKDDSLSSMILDGFQKCLYDNKITFEEQQVLYAPVENCYTSIIAQRLTGIISAHYSDALMLYEQLEHLHYYVPSSLSLASLSNSEQSAEYPYISCMPIPYYAFGCHVCKALIEKCEKSVQNSAPPLFTPDCALTHKKSIWIPSSLRLKKLVVAGSINMDLTFIVNRLPQAGKTTEILTSVISV
ncbi:MAG: LacI family DNA-binding transcriptional regulator, partial [Lachnospiraceae bacterium]|nr:LacI family DNA-binding transcriptional regulator [Lachnospiraceae bacterium]